MKEVESTFERQQKGFCPDVKGCFSHPSLQEEMVKFFFFFSFNFLSSFRSGTVQGQHIRTKGKTEGLITGEPCPIFVLSSHWPLDVIAIFCVSLPFSVSYPLSFHSFSCCFLGKRK